MRRALITYGELDPGAARRRGAARPRHRARRSRRPACPNLPWFPLAYFGILKAGAVVVPLNVLLKPREIAYHLKDSDAKALLAFEGTAELPIAVMASAACDESSCPHLLTHDRRPRGAEPGRPAC